MLLHLLPYVEIIGLNGVSKSLNGFQGFSPLIETVKTLRERISQCFRNEIRYD